MEINKPINNMNPVNINEIFKLRETSRALQSNYKLNFDVPIINRVSFGDKGLRCYESKTWKSLAFHIISSENLDTCKNIKKAGVV